MSIRPKWLKDIASITFTAYYLIFARQADDVVRKYFVADLTRSFGGGAVSAVSKCFELPGRRLAIHT